MNTQQRKSLSVRGRLILVLVLCAVACLLPAVMMSRSYLNEIDTAKREAVGIAPARDMLNLIRLVQQHRGLSAVWLGGDETAASGRAAKKQEVEAAISKFEAHVKGDGAAGTRLDKAWKRDREAWITLEQAVSARQVNGGQSSARHTTTIAAMLETLAEVLDHWGLSFDPTPATYFLIIGSLQNAPAMIELMGQTRARGANLLSTKAALDPAEKARFEALQTTMRTNFAVMRLTLEKAEEADARLKTSLEAPLRRLNELGSQGIKLAQDHVLAPPVPNFPAGDYFRQTTAVIDGMYEALGAVLNVLDAALIADAKHKQMISVSVIAVVFVLLGLAVAAGLLSARRIRGELGAEPGELKALALRVRDGDLGDRGAAASGLGTDDNSVMGALGAMTRRLSEVVSQVRQTADGVATASSQIAQGNGDLSARTEQQSGALQATAATMTELGQTVQNNAVNARQADELARSASTVAGEGGEAVAQVVQTMKSISESSRRIADIIGTIDGIAFQTNILALNAAVEAARAGEQGRGFAVVATEVRSLAQRSASAAREIKGLIENSAARVEAGSRQAEEAGRTMDGVVRSIRDVSGIVGEISNASNEQNTGVQQVGQSIQQLDHGTQQNAALVEQTAAAAQSLHQQADELVRAVSFFRLA